jgi:hypothetical protein
MHKLGVMCAPSMILASESVRLPLSVRLRRPDFTIFTVIRMLLSPEDQVERDPILPLDLASKICEYLKILATSVLKPVCSLLPCGKQLVRKLQETLCPSELSCENA